MLKAAFLDRDGVINRETGYVYRAEEFEFLTGVFEACRLLNEKDFEIVIVTNQAGIARGYYTEQDFHDLNKWMLQQFQQQGVRILDVRYCPFHPTAGIGEYKRESKYRKPGPQMILDAAVAHNIELSASFIAGDKQTDIEAGRAAGLGKVFLIESPQSPAEGVSGVPKYPDLLTLVQAEF